MLGARQVFDGWVPELSNGSSGILGAPGLSKPHLLAQLWDNVFEAG